MQLTIFDAIPAVPAGDSPLEQLVARHAEAARRWDTERTSTSRYEMSGAWTIPITHPGWDDTTGDEPFRLWTDHGCQPTVVTADTRTWDPTTRKRIGGALWYRGACLGCGWVADVVHDLAEHGENRAVEDAHDHTHPGWRDTPIVERAPIWQGTPSRAQLTRAEARQTEIAALHPPGWADRHGPTRSLRSNPIGTRHVPWRGWFDGYDICAGVERRGR